MYKDYLVDEIRAARESIVDEFGPDLRSIFQALKEKEEKSEREVVSFPAKPIHRHFASSLEERAKRGSREKFEAVLAKVPDVEPPEYDKL